MPEPSIWSGLGWPRRWTRVFLSGQPVAGGVVVLGRTKCAIVGCASNGARFRAVTPMNGR